MNVPRQPSFQPHFRYFVVLLGLTAAILPAAAAAAARHAAELVPANTIAFFGWNQFLDASSADTKRSRDAFQKFTQLVEMEEPEDAQMMRRVVGTLMDAGTGSGALALVDLPVRDGAVRPEVALVVAGMPSPMKLNDMVREMLADDGKTSGPIKLGDASLSVAAPEGEAQKLYYGVYKDTFLAVFGEATANSVLDIVRGSGKPLAGTPEYQESGKIVAKYAPKEHLVGFVNIQRAVAAGRAAMQASGDPLPPNLDTILDEVGISPLRTLHWRHGVTDNRLAGVTYLRIAAGADKGIIKALRQKPLDMNLLALAPADAYWACASAIDVNEVWREAMRVVTEIAPEAGAPVEGALSSARNVLGFSPTDDLLPNLGREWLFFDAPDHGSLLVTGTVMVLRPTNAQALHDMISRMGELASPLLSQVRSELRQVETKFSDKTIYTWLAAGLPSPLAPSWTQVEGHTAFALFPQTLRTMLKRVDAKTRNDDLIDNKEFLEAISAWPKELTAVSYVDSRAVGRLLYPIMIFFQTAVCSMTHEASKPIDFDAFPALPEMVERMRPTVGGNWHDQDGFFFAYGGSGGWIEQALFTPALAIGFSAAALIPAMAEAHHESQDRGAMMQMRNVGVACHEYAVDHAGEFPRTLEQLVESEKLTEPAARDVAYIHGQKVSVPSRNVLAYRMQNEGEAIVLFVDGHAEQVSREDFAQMLRDTYTNLNRTGEIPPEYRNQATSESPE